MFAGRIGSALLLIGFLTVGVRSADRPSTPETTPGGSKERPAGKGPTVRWTFEATDQKVWDFRTKSHTESTPCVVGGKVFFGAGDDGVYCLDARTGKEVWHFTGPHVDTNPAVEGGRLYAGSGYGKPNEIFCLDTT